MSEVIRHIPQERGITKIALMRGEEMLSQTLIVPMTLQMGRARLRMDGIGGVATPEEHRNKGYSRRVLEAAVAHMSAGDAVVSTLYGIPRFYPKYGFATLGPEYTIAPISLEERAELPASHAARAGAPGDLTAIQRLYRQQTACAYGAAVRDDDWWTWGEIERGLEPGADGVRVIERDGHLVAYAFRADGAWWMQHLARDTPPSLKIGEGFAADRDAADAVLAACRRWAVELGETAAVLAIPPDSQVGQAAMFQNARIEALYGDECEFMGRSVGLVALMRAMAPELDDRWRDHRATEPPFSLAVTVGRERATISGDESGVEIDAIRPADIEVTLGPGTMARLVFGGFEPEAVLGRSHVSPAARATLAMLFPRHVPYIYPVDRF